MSGYLDDIYALVRSQEDAALALAAARQAGAEVGLCLHPGKSTFVGREVLDTQEVEVLGGHVGSEAR